MALLSVRNLTVEFQTPAGLVRVVDDISFDLDKGKTLGLVGESGCGKTMSALAILGLLEKSKTANVQGEVLFEGINLLKSDEKQIRDLRGKQISMIFQDPMTSLNPFLTIGDQLSEVLTNHFCVSKSEAKRRSCETLEKVGISNSVDRMEQYPHQFSGGMRQRVMIAMALLCSPKLLIADEPTTALDVTIQAQVLKLLDDLKAEYEMSIILVTHDLGVVAGMTDDVAVMYAGKIVERTSTENLFERSAHPYTQALLKSLPQAQAETSGKLQTIPGSPPDLSNLPKGCAFHPRCPNRVKRCEADRPILKTYITKHEASCWEIKE